MEAILPREANSPGKAPCGKKWVGGNLVWETEREREHETNISAERKYYILYCIYIVFIYIIIIINFYIYFIYWIILFSQ